MADTLNCSYSFRVDPAMPKFRITYTVAGRVPRRELVTEFALGGATARAVARAILEYEFAQVDSPFGAYEALTAEQALKRFAVTDVRTSLVDDAGSE